MKKIWNWVRSWFFASPAADSAPVVVFYKCGNCGAFLQPAQAFCEVCGLNLQKETFEACAAPALGTDDPGRDICRTWVEQPHQAYCTGCGRNLGLCGTEFLPTRIRSTAS